MTLIDTVVEKFVPYHSGINDEEERQRYIESLKLFARDLLLAVREGIAVMKKRDTGGDLMHQDGTRCCLSDVLHLLDELSKP